MRFDRLWKMGLACMATVVVLAGTSLVMAAPMLYEIAPVGASTTTQGRAITPDGKYVVGTPGSGMSEGFIWDALGGSRIINGGGAVAHDAVGVGYRTYNAQQEIVVFGNSTGGTVGPTYWISSDGGYTFGPKLRRTGVGSNFPAANALVGSSLQADGWYDTYQNPNEVQFWVENGTGAPALTSILQDQKDTNPDQSKMQGVSSTGLAVGFRRPGGVYQNWVTYYNGGGGNVGGLKYVNGLRTNFGGNENRQGQLWAVSANSTKTDNRAGGMGPVDDADLYGTRLGNWPFVVDDFDADADDTGTATELRTFDSDFVNPYGTSGTNGNVYGLSADGRYAVGMDYTLGAEKAVLWDISNPDPANWTETDLTQWATDNGVLGDFGSLRRAYSVGVTDEGSPAITGYGVTTDLSVRGFVLYFDLDVPVFGPGDANGDSVVDAKDASALGAHWLMQSGATWAMGDFNADKKVDDKDAAILAANWSTGIGASVPEPGTLVLLVSAAVALWFRRRR